MFTTFFYVSMWGFGGPQQNLSIHWAISDRSWQIGPLKDWHMMYNKGGFLFQKTKLLKTEFPGFVDGLVWTVCHRETIFLIQIFFCDQMMFWTFEFFGRHWLLECIITCKSMKSMVFVVRCRESIVFIQIFFCDQIIFYTFDFFGRHWLLEHIITSLAPARWAEDPEIAVEK